MKAIFTALLCVGAALAGPSSATAQQYPNRPVTIVVPFSAGASNDIFGRYVAEGLSKLWKQPVLVENRPGGGAAIGTGYVAKSKPDGYTLVFSSSTFTINAAVMTNLTFDSMKDLKPVAMAALGEILIVTGSRIPIPTLAELVKQAKAQKIFYGSTGPTTFPTFASELLNDEAGIKMEGVNYRGGTEALVDLAGGRIDVYIGTVTSILPSVQNNTARPVAIASKTRSPSLPNVPTVAEAGYPGAQTDIWWGLFAPTGTPSDVLTKINQDVTAVMNTPDAKAFLEKQGAAPTTATIDEFSKRVASELGTWQALAKKHNITAQ